MNIFKSFKHQLAFICALFILFVGIVFLQFFLSYNMQMENLKEFSFGNDVIREYLKLEESESVILDQIRKIVDAPKNTIPDDEYSSIISERDSYFQKLQYWNATYDAWRHKFKLNIDDNLFPGDYILKKRRQVEAYGTILALCREGNHKEAASLFSIEQNYRPTIHKIINALLAAVEKQRQTANLLSRNLYFSAVVFLLAMMGVLCLTSYKFFKTCEFDLKSLSRAASRIAKGDFSRIIGITNPEEIAEVALAFNDMQAALKTRDGKIREDSEEIRKFNEALEQKIETHTRKISEQNITLQHKVQELEEILSAFSFSVRPMLNHLRTRVENISNVGSIMTERLEMNSLGENELRDEVAKTAAESKRAQLVMKRLHRMLDGISAVSAMSFPRGSAVPVDLNPVLTEIKTEFDKRLAGKNAEIRISKLDNCFGDSKLLKAAFMAIVDNCAKYRSPDRDLLVKVFSKTTCNSIVYTVEDNGIGIAGEFLSRVFEIFFRINPDGEIGGEGLGLSIVKRCVYLHSGNVWIESTPGKGTSVQIELPLIGRGIGG